MFYLLFNYSPLSIDGKFSFCLLFLFLVYNLKILSRGFYRGGGYVIKLLRDVVEKLFGLSDRRLKTEAYCE